MTSTIESCLAKQLEDTNINLRPLASFHLFLPFIRVFTN